MTTLHRPVLLGFRAAAALLAVGLSALLPSVCSAQLSMWFSNSSSYDASSVWITIQRGQSPTSDVTQVANRPNVTYGESFTSFNWQMYSNATGTVWQPGTYGNLFSETVALSSMTNSSGLGLITWNGNAASAAVYVSYGTPFIGGTGSSSNNYTVSGVSANNPSDPNYHVAYQPFEITYGTGAGGTPGAGDQGNLTAINYFGAAMRLQNFASADATGTPLQEVGFHQSGPILGANLAAITASNPIPSGGAEGNSGGPAVITNTSGDVVRIIGPSQFGASQTAGWGFGNYGSFNSYLAGAGSGAALFTNNSAYNTVPKPGELAPSAPYTNKSVSFAFDNSVINTTNGYALNPSGTITVVTTAFASGASGGPTSITTNTYNNITFSVNPTGQGGSLDPIANIASQFVYLGSYTAWDGFGTYSWFDGADWVSFSNSMTGFVDGGGTNAVNDVTAQIAGEVATGFAAGFVGSPDFGNLPSDQWWALNPSNAFSGATANSNNYNQYAGLIADASSNSVYGMVYSDRFLDSSPLINSYQLNGTNIGSWLVILGDPITPVPEPSTFALLALAGMTAAGLWMRRRRS